MDSVLPLCRNVPLLALPAVWLSVATATAAESDVPGVVSGDGSAKVADAPALGPLGRKEPPGLKLRLEAGMVTPPAGTVTQSVAATDAVQGVLAARVSTTVM